MAVGNPLYIVLDLVNKVVKMTQDPAGVNNVETIPASMIEGVFPIIVNNKPGPPDDAYWIYPYDSMTVVAIRFRGAVRPEIRMELQDVVGPNAATWGTGTQAGINQCVTDFTALLALI